MPGAAVIEGLPERFISGLRFQDVTLAQGAVAGISCTVAEDVSISNFTVGALEDPAIDAREVRRLEIHRLRCARPRRSSPWSGSRTSAARWCTAATSAAPAGPSGGSVRKSARTWSSTSAGS
jgi:hypothetical protein